MKIIAGNWKLNPANLEQASALASAVVESSKSLVNSKVIILPPTIYLTSLKQVAAGSMVSLGAQNVSNYEAGAYTGETALSMLEGLVEYVLVGHSERRTLFGETDEVVNLKLRGAVTSASITPILCVGETEEVRNAGNYVMHVLNQLQQAFHEVTQPDMERTIIAYEPVWAIGTGRIATAAEAEEVMSAIKQKYPLNQVIYGGSVNAANVHELADQNSNDGFLVGGASLKSEDFAKICQILEG